MFSGKRRIIHCCYWLLPPTVCIVWKNHVSLSSQEQKCSLWCLARLWCLLTWNCFHLYHVWCFLSFQCVFIQKPLLRISLQRKKVKVISLGKEGKRKVRKWFNQINNALNCQKSIEAEQMGCVCQLICIRNTLALPRFSVSLLLNILLLYSCLCAPLHTHFSNR